MGSGFGSFIASMIMKNFGFDASKAVQSVASLHGISFSFLWAPIIFYVISMLLMIGYRKWEKHEPIVKRDLEARQASATN